MNKTNDVIEVSNSHELSKAIGDGRLNPHSTLFVKYYEGDLELDNLKIKSIIFIGARIEGRVILNNVSCNDIFLEGAKMDGFAIDYSMIKGRILASKIDLLYFVIKSTTVLGAINLSGANIKKHFRVAISYLKSDVVLDNSIIDRLEVSSTNIGGDFRCKGILIGTWINLGTSLIRGSVIFSGITCSTDCKLECVSLKIVNDFDLSGIEWKGSVLILSDSKIGGSFLINNSKIYGRLSIGGQVMENFIASSSHFLGEENKIISKIWGDLFLNNSRFGNKLLVETEIGGRYYNIGIEVIGDKMERVRRSHLNNAEKVMYFLRSKISNKKIQKAIRVFWASQGATLFRSDLNS